MKIKALFLLGLFSLTPSTLGINSEKRTILGFDVEKLEPQTPLAKIGLGFIALSAASFVAVIALNSDVEETLIKKIQINPGPPTSFHTAPPFLKYGFGFIMVLTGIKGSYYIAQGLSDLYCSGKLCLNRLQERLATNCSK